MSNSLHFKQFIDFLVFCKNPTIKQDWELCKDVLALIKGAQLRICIDCWELITEGEIESNHSTVSGQVVKKHNLTSKFSDMQTAEKEKVLQLFKDNNKTSGNGPEMKVTLMTFSNVMKQKLNKFEKFKKGKLSYLFATPSAPAASAKTSKV